MESCSTFIREISICNTHWLTPLLLIGQDTQKRLKKRRKRRRRTFGEGDVSGRKTSSHPKKLRHVLSMEGRWQFRLKKVAGGKTQWCVWRENYANKQGDERVSATQLLAKIIESKDVTGHSGHPSSISSLYRWRSKLRGVTWLGQGDIANEWWIWDQSPGLLITLLMLFHYTMLILCICANE